MANSKTSPPLGKKPPMTPKGSDGAQIRRITIPLFRGFLAAIVVFIAYALLFGGDKKADLSSTNPTPTQTLAPGVTVPSTENPLGTGTDTGIGTANDLDNTGNAPAINALPGVGVNVQVLKGASTSDTAYESAINVLNQLGYTVKRGGTAASDYASTTVFVVTGKEQEAQNLMAADNRFAINKPKPESITAPDDIHIVIGTDWVASTAEGETGALGTTTDSTLEGGESDLADQTAVPAGAEGISSSQVVPNYAGASANTANIGTSGVGTTTTLQPIDSAPAINSNASAIDPAPPVTGD